MAYIDIFNTDKKYQIIYADPPWKQSKGGKKAVRANSSGKELDYHTCSLSEIEFESSVILYSTITADDVAPSTGRMHY